MKKLLFLLLTSLLCSPAFSQSTEETPFLKHYIGFDAGASSGYGMSYRYQPKEWGIQVNMFPAASADEYHISIGATVIRSLYRTHKMQFFLYYGNHLLFQKDEVDYYYGYDTTPTRQWVTGIGPGFEVYIAKRLAINARFGFAYYSATTDNDWMINADGGIGMHFMF